MVDNARAYASGNFSSQDWMRKEGPREGGVCLSSRRVIRTICASSGLMWKVQHVGK